ncbi:MAG: translocation/assembly module TamB domain-containing protein [Formivibrio sp.]|nr:translocation/assembly module TamB domain-containing protein [Formivibrio sp.]
MMSESAKMPTHPICRKILRRLAWGALALLLPLVLLMASLAGLDTPTGHDWLRQQVNRSGVVQLAAIDGSLWRTLTLQGFKLDSADVHLDADQVEISWQPRALLMMRMQVDSLKIGNAELVLKPSPPDRPPGIPPLDLRLPLAIVLDHAEIGTFRIAKPALVFSAIHFSFSSDGRHHHLELAQLLSPQGKSQASLTVDGNAPFASNGQFAFKGEFEGRTVNTQGSLKGPLRDLQLISSVESPGAKGQVDARLDLFAPYAYQMLREGHVALNHINPAHVMPNLPQADLDIRLDLRPTGEGAASGRLEIINHQPGALNAQLIPLQELNTQLAYAGEQLQFSALQASVGGGKLQGKGAIGRGKLGLEFDIAALDLARLWARQPVTSLNGKLSLNGPWLAPDIRADLADTPRRARLQVDLGWLNPQKERRLQIRQARLQRGTSQLHGAGELGLQGKLDFKLAGEFTRVNPAEFASVPSGQLSGAFKTEGYLQPRPVISLDYKLSDSRFNGESLQGQGHLRLEDKRLADSNFWLMLGRNRIDAQGALGGKTDVLQAKLNWPVLRSLGKDFTGSAEGVVRISGPFSDPTFDGQLNLADLTTPFGVAVKNAHLDAHLQQGMQTPLRLRLDATHWQQGELILDKVLAQVEGSRSQHNANVSLSGKVGTRSVDLQAQLAGGLDAGWRWKGELRQLNVLGALPLHLQNPTSLEAGAQRVSLGDSRWLLGKAQVDLLRTIWQPGQIESTGKLSGLSLAEWLKLGGFNDYSTDLILGGDWQLQLGQDLHDLNGVVNVVRESGDSLWRGPPSNQVPFSLREASVKMKVLHNRIDLNGSVSSTRYGNIVLSGDTRIDPASGKIVEGAALNLRVKGELPQLAAFNPLVGPDLQLAGRLSFDVRRSGTLKAMALSGTVNGDGLAIQDVASGLHLQDGVVRMNLAEQRITLQQCTFKGGQGDLNAHGVVDLRGDTPSGQAQVEANRLTLFSRSDLLLVISGKGDLGIQKGQISVSGKLRADQGDIEYRSADVPHLSDDVVVLGRERPAARALPPFSLSVDVDLGDNFRFRGYGLDARLNGLLRLRAQPGRSLAANGVVRVKEGNYRAWGQRLDIERGQLSFLGAVDNPGLDILAMRRNQAVEAGVVVSGTALNPRVQLYSEPSVPDTEKLAWLLFGHGTDGMEKSDSILMLQAARTLLGGGGQDKGLGDAILGQVGIDEVGMRSVRETDGKSTQIVTVSKQLGHNFRVALEKSINGLRDGVTLTFQISHGWALNSRVGNDESSVGATYTVQFE